MKEIYCNKDGRTLTLKERLIQNTEQLMKATINPETKTTYTTLIDYIRGLFHELYNLDIYDFTDQETTKKYFKQYPGSNLKQGWVKKKGKKNDNLYQPTHTKIRSRQRRHKTYKCKNISRNTKRRTNRNNHKQGQHHKCKTKTLAQTIH